MSNRSYSRESLLDPTGVRFDDAFELLSYLDQFLAIGIFVQRMEVMKIMEDREVPSIDESIIGVDGDSNWSHHEDPILMTELARQKLSSALRAAPCSAKVWFEAVD